MLSSGRTRRLVISQGDPQGVGPDLLLQAAGHDWLRETDVVVADATVLCRRAERLGTEWARRGLQTILGLLDDTWDAPSQMGALSRAVDLMQAAPDPHAVALVTAPIDKAIAASEGLPTPGHTEYLALRTKAPEVAMLMAGPILRVTLATVHIALKAVPQALDAGTISRRTELLLQALLQIYGIEHPRIGILALNPHAGEGGRFGNEEQQLLEGLVSSLAQKHQGQASITGPLPADTAFALHVQGHLDGLVAMYHDQGLAPFKLLHFHDGVNVTLGLPFLRTSPDHGTAKDKAGTLEVDPRSFFSSICLARGDKAALKAWIQQET